MPREYEEIKASLRKRYPNLAESEIETRAAKIFGSIFGTNPQHAHQLANEGKWEEYKKSHSKKEFDENEIFKLDFQSLELKEENGEFYVETFVSTPDLDFGNDIISEQAQDEIVEQMLASPSANKVSLFHKREGEAPIGRVVDARVVQHEGKTKSWAKIMLNRDHPQFKSVVNMIKNGFIDASSIEYQAKSWVHKLIGNTMVRVVDGINMLGFALTGRPMNPNARIQNFYVKSFDVGDSMEVEEKAVWTTAYVNTLPDSAFAYVEDGEKDEEGKTVPRSKRHLPYKDKDGKVDLAHLRNALARLSQTNISAEAKASARRKLVSAARSSGVQVSEEDKKEVDIMENTEVKVEEKVEKKEETPSKEAELAKALEQKEIEMKEMQAKLDKLEADKKAMEVETKEVELLKKEIEALKVEGKVLVEQKEKAASEHKAIETEMKEYIEKPSWEKARELANKLF